MGILHGLTSVDKPFIWTMTHQRAFEQVKEQVGKFRDHSRICMAETYLILTW